MNYLLETYGCQMNVAESAAMERVLRERGWRPVKDAGRPAEDTGRPAEDTGRPAEDTGRPFRLVILNTCAVRATAEQRVQGRLAHWNALRREVVRDTGQPFAILVAGCAAANIADALREGGADYLLPPAEQRRFADILRELEMSSFSENPPEILNPPETDGGFSRTHYAEGAASAFVPIMRGCDNFCSYCIVPHVRGRETSRPAGAILAELDFLAEKGVREITLLGQNVNAYNGDVPDGFAGLIRLTARRLKGTPIRWARFLSPHPKDMNPGVIEALAENPCFCRHIHLPLQHGSNRILTLMNRRYTRESYLALVQQLRAALPGLTLTTDILVGFPGETEEDIALLLALMREVRFDAAFTYHYNPREGTAAFSMPGRIDESLKRERLARVIELQNSHTKAARKAALGTERLVLCGKPSRKNGAEFLCHSEHEEMCVLSGAKAGAGGARDNRVQTGNFLRARLASLAGNTFRCDTL